MGRFYTDSSGNLRASPSSSTPSSSSTSSSGSSSSSSSGTSSSGGSSGGSSSQTTSSGSSGSSKSYLYTDPKTGQLMTTTSPSVLLQKTVEGAGSAKAVSQIKLPVSAEQSLGYSSSSGSSLSSFSGSNTLTGPSQLSQAINAANLASKGSTTAPKVVTTDQTSNAILTNIGGISAKNLKSLSTPITGEELASGSRGTIDMPGQYYTSSGVAYATREERNYAEAQLKGARTTRDINVKVLESKASEDLRSSVLGSSYYQEQKAAAEKKITDLASAESARVKQFEERGTFKDGTLYFTEQSDIDAYNKAVATANERITKESEKINLDFKNKITAYSTSKEVTEPIQSKYKTEVEKLNNLLISKAYPSEELNITGKSTTYDVGSVKTAYESGLSTPTGTYKGTIITMPELAKSDLLIKEKAKESAPKTYLESGLMAATALTLLTPIPGDEALVGSLWTSRAALAGRTIQSTARSVAAANLLIGTGREVSAGINVLSKTGLETYSIKSEPTYTEALQYATYKESEKFFDPQASIFKSYYAPSLNIRDYYETAKGGVFAIGRGVISPYTGGTQEFESRFTEYYKSKGFTDEQISTRLNIAKGERTSDVITAPVAILGINLFSELSGRAGFGIAAAKKEFAGVQTTKFFTKERGALALRSFKEIAPLGFAEGATIYETQQSTYYQPKEFTGYLRSGVEGAVTAGAITGTLVGTQATTSLRAKSVGKVTEVTSNILDVAEPLTDYTATLLQRYKKVLPVESEFRIAGETAYLKPKAVTPKGENIIGKFAKAKTITTGSQSGIIAASKPGTLSQTQVPNLAFSSKSFTQSAINIPSISSSSSAYTVTETKTSPGVNTNIITSVNIPTDVSTNVNVPIQLQTNIPTTTQSKVQLPVQPNIFVGDSGLSGAGIGLGGSGIGRGFGRLSSGSRYNKVKNLFFTGSQKKQSFKLKSSFAIKRFI